MSDGRVFIVHNAQRFDVSDTHRFGRPVVLFTKDVYPDTSDAVGMIHIMAYVRDALKDFDPDRDSLCLIGSPVYTAVCVFVLAQQGVRRVRLLRFDRRASSYYPIDIE